MRLLAAAAFAAALLASIVMSDISLFDNTPSPEPPVVLTYTPKAVTVPLRVLADGCSSPPTYSIVWSFDENGCKDTSNDEDGEESIRFIQNGTSYLWGTYDNRNCNNSGILSERVATCGVCPGYPAWVADCNCAAVANGKCCGFECTSMVCDQGWFDADGLASNGCESTRPPAGEIPSAHWDVPDCPASTAPNDFLVIPDANGCMETGNESMGFVQTGDSFVWKKYQDATCTTPTTEQPVEIRGACGSCVNFYSDEEDETQSIRFTCPLPNNNNNDSPASTLHVFLPVVASLAVLVISLLS